MSKVMPGNFTFPAWTNSVELPIRGNVASLFPELEVKFKFTVCAGSPLSVFISEETDFDFLTQLVCFFPPETPVYACPLLLIRERLHYIALGQENTESNSVSRYLISLFETAINKNATDIHIDEGEKLKRVRFRINGQLHDFDEFQQFEAGIRVKIKLLTGMNISESRRPQEGGMHYNNARGKRFYFRVSVSPGVYHEKIALRILPEEHVTRTLSSLNFSSEIHRELTRFIDGQSGWMIVCGPTGSGKTTTLYGILHELKRKNLSIETIEDPVEYRMDGIHQTEVDPDLGITFSNSLKHALRLDPDVILVGEIRDEETALLALKAAQTGHVVLSSLHSNSPLEAITRLKTLHLNPEDIYSSVKMIVAQRLVQKSCDCNRDKNCPACLGSGICGRIPANKFIKIDPTMSYEDFIAMMKIRDMPKNMAAFCHTDSHFNSAVK